MADEVFTVGYKIDTAGIEGNAEAAGKLVKEGFEKGFGTIDLRGAINKGMTGDARGGAAAPAGGAGLLGGSVDDVKESVAKINEALASIKLPDNFGDKISQQLQAVRHREGAEQGFGKQIAEGAEVAEKGVENLSRAFGGLTEFLTSGSIVGLSRSFGAMSESAGSVLSKMGVLPEVTTKVAGGIAAVGVAGYEAAKGVTEAADRGAELVIQMDDISRSTGLSKGSILGHREAFRGFGLDFNEFVRGLAHAQLVTQEAHAQIAKNISEEGDQTAEANERVLDSYRKRQDAQDSLADSQEKVIGVRAKAAVTLAGAAIRDQIAAEAGPLQVVGAMIGLGEAQEQQRFQGAVGPLNVRAAQRQARVVAATAEDRERIEDVAGPLTLAGARLSVQGAGIQAERAGMQFRQFAYGERPDPERVKELNYQEQQLKVNVAQHNLAEAQLNEDRAKTAEEGRQAAGPHAEDDIVKAFQTALHVENENQLAQRRAALGTQQARLGVEGAEVGEEERQQYLAVTGSNIPGRMSPGQQVIDVARELGRARRGEERAEADIPRAEREEGAAVRAQGYLPSTQPGAVAQALMGRRTDIDLSAVQRGVLTDALIHLGSTEFGGPEGTGTEGALSDILKRFGQGEGSQFPQLGENLLSGLFGRNITSAGGYLRALENLPEGALQKIQRRQLTPEERAQYGEEGVGIAEEERSKFFGVQSAKEDTLVAALPRVAPGVNQLRESETKLIETSRKEVISQAGDVADGLGKVASTLESGAGEIGAAIGKMTDALGGGGEGGTKVREALEFGGLAGVGITGVSLLKSAAGRLLGWAGGALGLGGAGGAGAAGVGAAGAGAAEAVGGAVLPEVVGGALAAGTAGAATGAEGGALVGGIPGLVIGALIGGLAGFGASYLFGGKPGEQQPPAGPPTTPPVPGALAAGTAPQAGAGVGNELSAAAGELSQAASALSSAASALGSSGGGNKGADSGGQGAPSATATEQAEGGLIHGSGESSSDNIPIMASPFEYVVKASSVGKYGVGLLDRINAGHFASGGLVQEAVKIGIDKSKAEDMSDEELEREISVVQRQRSQGQGRVGWLQSLQSLNILLDPARLGAEARSSEVGKELAEAFSRIQSGVKAEQEHSLPMRVLEHTSHEGRVSETLRQMHEQAARRAEIRQAQAGSSEPMRDRPEAGSPTVAEQIGPLHDRPPYPADEPFVIINGRRIRTHRDRAPVEPDEIAGTQGGLGPGEGGRGVSRRGVINVFDPAAGQQPRRRMEDADEAFAHMRPHIRDLLSRFTGQAPSRSRLPHEETAEQTSHGHASLAEFNRLAADAGMAVIKGVYGHDTSIDEGGKRYALNEPDVPMRFSIRPGESTDDAFFRSRAEHENQDYRRRGVKTFETPFDSLPGVPYDDETGEARRPRSRRRRRDDGYAFGGLVRRLQEGGRVVRRPHHHAETAPADEKFGDEHGDAPEPNVSPKAAYELNKMFREDMEEESAKNRQFWAEFRPAEKWNRLPASENIEDRRGEWNWRWDMRGEFASGGMVRGLQDGGRLDDPNEATGYGAALRQARILNAQQEAISGWNAARDRPRAIAEFKRRQERQEEEDWKQRRKGRAFEQYGGLIPARVSPGEYRMSGGAVARHGLAMMDAINAGRFQLGGYTGIGLGAGNVIYNPIVSEQEALGGQQLVRPVFSGEDYLNQRTRLNALAASQVWAAADPSSGFAARFASSVGLTSLMAMPSQIPGLPAGGGAISDNTLNLLTSGGTFTVNASSDTIEAIRSSAIGAKLTSAGTKPSWY